MSRLVFPDDTLVYQIQGNILMGKPGAKVYIYTDAAATVLADIQDMTNNTLPGSYVTVDSSSQLKLFQGPNDGRDTLYAKPEGVAAVTPIYARVDDRLDTLLTKAEADNLYSQVPQGITSPTGFGDTTRLSPAGNGTYVVGVDKVAGSLIYVDTSAGNLLGSQDWGTTNDFGYKELPPDVAFQNFGSVVRHGAYIYAVGMTTTGSVTKIWRSLPAVGNGTTYTWVAVKTMAAGSQAFQKQLTSDGIYLYACEYGAPGVGASVYRTADGVTWTTVLAADLTITHHHCIEVDPYNPGHVWLTSGDGTAKTIRRSIDNGDTWDIIIAESNWQAVQISFDTERIWFASDTGRHTVITLDRATFTPRAASTNFHYNIAVPGGAVGDRYFKAAYFGAVDPDTGIYYCTANDNSKPGNTNGWFYLPKVGHPIEILSANTLSGPVFIAGGYVLAGNSRHELLNVS